MARIGVVGAGAWGTALAIVAYRAGHQVALWGRRPRDVRACSQRENAARLPGITLPEAVLPRTLPEVTGAACLLLAVPAQVCGAWSGRCRRGHAAGDRGEGPERASGLRLSEVVVEERPEATVAAFLGRRSRWRWHGACRPL